MNARIESAIGRELEREYRAGVPHFKQGQLHAHRVDGELDVFELSFVDAVGRAWLILVDLDLADDDRAIWTPLAAFAGGITYMKERPVEPLSPSMIETLEAARAAPDGS